MVSIGMEAPPRRVTLADLLSERDSSIELKPSAFALAVLRAKRAFGAASAVGVRASVTLVLALAAFVFRHGLVLAGLASFALAGWLYSPIAGLVTAGAGAFFLELRRR